METQGILVFTAVFLMVLGIDQLLFSGRHQVGKRLDRLKALEQKSMPDIKKRTNFLRNVLTWAGELSISRRMGRSIDKKLEEADILLRGGEFIVIVILVIIVTVFFVFSMTTSLTHGLLSGIISGMVPFFILNTARSKRLNSFNAQISDGLTIMGNSLRSGFSLLQSMDMVRKELPDPIGKEFYRTLVEIKLGTPTETALENMSKRVNSEDLDLVVTAVLIQRQVGGNLSEVLDTIAGEIRDRIRIKREIRTLTAQGRISGTIIGLLPVILGLFIFIVKPDYIIELVKNPIGMVMLLAAVLGEIIGMFVIKKIVNIKF